MSTSAENIPVYLSIAEAARLAGMTRSTMGYHIAQGSVKAVPVAGRQLIEKGEAERFAAIPRKRGPKPKAEAAA